MAVESTFEKDPHPFGKVEMIYSMIMELSTKEQRELLSLLNGGDDPDIGVREPRRPLHPSQSGAAVAEIEVDDEWVLPEGTTFG